METIIFSHYIMIKQSTNLKKHESKQVVKNKFAMVEDSILELQKKS